MRGEAVTSQVSLATNQAAKTTRRDPCLTERLHSLPAALRALASLPRSFCMAMVRGSPLRAARRALFSARARSSARTAEVRSFARTLSAELVGRRIRVNAVSPGLIETPILRGVGQSEHPGQTEAEFRDYLVGASKLIPIGRLGQPDEIAAAVLFL